MRPPVSCFELRFGCCHQWRGAGKARANRAEIDRLVLHLRVIQERDEEGGDSAEKRRPDTVDRLQQILDVARVWHERHRRAADEAVALDADARVHMKQRQRARAKCPRAHSSDDAARHSVVRQLLQNSDAADDGLGRSGRASAHQHDGRIAGRGGSALRVRASTGCQQILKPHVTWLDRHPVPALLLLEQREQHAQNGREVFLDARRDDQSSQASGAEFPSAACRTV